jgi:hypothetical protein
LPVGAAVLAAVVFAPVDEAAAVLDCPPDELLLLALLSVAAPPPHAASETSEATESTPSERTIVKDFMGRVEPFENEK